MIEDVANAGVDGLSGDKKRELLKQKLREKIGDFQSLHPLSIGQQALWFLHKIAPKSAAYNIMCAARVNSDINIKKLKQAFKALAERHPGLRSTYRELKGKPYQVVHEQRGVPFEVIDVNTSSDEELNLQLGRYADEPIDLENGVMRVNLFKRDSGDHVLLLVYHHIAIDFWALDLLIQELFLFYSLEPTEVQSIFPPLRGKFAEFVRWQKAMLEGIEGERHWEYWRQQLNGELPVLNLCTDKPRPKVQTYAGRDYSFDVEPELCRKLRKLARDQGTTLFTVVLATFKVLLHRYSQQNDIIVATPAVGRSHPEWEDVVGYFSNSLAIRSHFGPELTVESYIAQLRQTMAGALEHQDYPFPTLVERLGGKRDPSRSPVFQVLFMWDKGKWHESERLSTGLRLEPIAFGQRGAPFDINAIVVEKEHSLTVILSYNIDLFEEHTISQLARHFHTLLKENADDPTRQISRLPFLSAGELQQLLLDWNNTATTCFQSTSAHQLISQQARRTPEAVALEYEGQQLSYVELDSRANKLARYLVSLGVSRNTLVAVMLERSNEMVVAILAVLKAGGAYIPVDPSYPQDRVDYMLNDARPRLLLTQQDKLASLTLDDKQIIRIDSEWAEIDQESGEELADISAAEDLAYVIYTSGSTGHPKGVQITHAALTNFLQDMKSHFNAEDVLVAVTTLSFDIAALEIFGPLITGARTVIVSSEVAADGVSLSEVLKRSGASIMQATPTSWCLLLQAGWEGQPNFKALCGGEALSQALANRLLGCCGSLWNLYGPTETTIWSSKFKVELTNRTTVPIGRPIANTRIYILDAMGQPVPKGVSGELHIGGAGLSVGYLNQPLLTDEKFIPNPFADSPQARLYKTGDLARYLPGGAIEYLGRLDQQVKVNGYRIELEEIEKQLCKYPGVAEAVVSTDQDDNGVKRLIAYIVSDNKSEASNIDSAEGKTDLSVHRLRNFLSRVLPVYMLPASYMFLSALPLTPNGKIDRKALPKPDGVIPELEQDYLAPGTELESLLCEIWARTLKVDRVGINDNFFDLGGASLQSVEVVSKLREADCDVKPEMFFEYQTIAELAAAIELVDPSTIQDNEIVDDAAPPTKSQPITAENDWQTETHCVSRLESIGVYLPPTSVTTKAMLKGCRKKVLFPLERMTGIKSRRVADADDYAYELAAKGVEECLRQSAYTTAHIDLLICCSVSRYDGPNRLSYEPSTAQRLQAAFGFHNAIAFDISNACAGMFTGILISDALIKTGAVRCALVVSGEYTTHLSENAQQEINGFMDSRLACLTVGDAGAAVILEASPDSAIGFQQLDMYTLGKYSDLCTAKLSEADHGGAIMYTDSINQTLVAARNAVMHGEQIMQRAGWRPDSFDWLIMHQTSETALRDVARALNESFGQAICNDANTVYNLAERGNTATTTHFVALRDLIDQGKMQNDEKVIFGISGSGQNVGTALYQLDDLPNRMRRSAPAPKRKSWLATPPRQPQVRVTMDALGNLGCAHGHAPDALQLARRAAEQCLRAADASASDIDLLLYAGIYRNDFLVEPAMAALLAGELKMNDDITTVNDRRSFVFDLLHGGVGFLTGCYVASRLLQANRYHNALVVSAEIENNRGTTAPVLRGIEESAVALMLKAKPDGQQGFGHFIFHNLPEYLESQIAYTSRDKEHGGQVYLHYEQSPALHQYYLDGITTAIDNLLTLEGLKREMVTVVLGPQFGEAFNVELSHRLGIDADKIMDSGHRGEDLLTCDLVYTLAYARQAQKVRLGDIGLLISVGSGLQVGCAIYYF